MLQLKTIVPVLVLLVVSLWSCGDKYNLQLQSPKTIQVNEPLNISVKEKNGMPIDSVAYFLDGNRITGEDALDVSSFRLGRHAISVKVYYEGQEKKLNNTVYFRAAEAPKVYGFSIVNEYPHDPGAFTQGLVYHEGYFYESTGQIGRSSLRKVEVETGKVVQKLDLERQYFGEGMTIYNNKIYQLTWKKKVGFVYDLDSFELEKTFDYGQSKEGWGLTHNNEHLIKTDGSERMWFLDPETLQEKKFIETYTNKRKAEKLNELEFINGKIYANIWQQNSILIVNPVNGAIEAIVNLKGLQRKAGQEGEDNVLNGIAYDQEKDRLFVTGKNWNKVFEIRIE
jgi:glutamine cyclotransferase